MIMTEMNIQKNICHNKNTWGSLCFSILHKLSFTQSEQLETVEVGGLYRKLVYNKQMYP